MNYLILFFVRKVLYLFVFLCRYLDIFDEGGYLYNTIFKIFYVAITITLVGLLTAAQQHPPTFCPLSRWVGYYQKEADTFQTIFVVLPSLVTGFVMTPTATLTPGDGVSYFGVSIKEFLWTVSIFLCVHFTHMYCNCLI